MTQTHAELFVRGCAFEVLLASKELLEIYLPTCLPGRRVGLAAEEENGPRVLCRK